MADDRDALRELSSLSRMDAVHPVRHFLYLPNKQAAGNVVSLMRSLDLAVERPCKTYDKTWLVRVTTSVVPTEAKIAELRAVMERAANENAGEYDGWEAEVQS